MAMKPGQPPPQPPPQRVPPRSGTAADAVVLKLLAAQRVHGMYPSNNPNVGVALGRLRAALATFAPGEGLQLDIAREGIHFGDLLVQPQHAEVRAFAESLYLAHISAIVLLPEVTNEELVTVFDLLKLPADERAAKGPLEGVIARSGVKHVIVREAGRSKVVEENDDPDAWDLSTVSEFEHLETKIFGRAGTTEMKQVLRAVTDGARLRASRLIAMLERPRTFAQYLVDLASRVRPHDRVDLNAQLSMLEALVAMMETVLERLPDADRIHLYVKLDLVIAWISTAIHKSMFGSEGAPFLGVGPVAALFPEVVPDLDLRRAFSSRKLPSAALSPVLMSSLRRIAAGDSELARLYDGTPARFTPRDPGALASYRAPVLPFASPQTPPLPLPPDFLVAGSSGASARMVRDLGSALATAVPAIDLIESLDDLLRGEASREGAGPLLEALISCFRYAIESRNPHAAAAALSVLQAKAGQGPLDPALATEMDRAVARCASPEIMEPFVKLLADLEPESEESRTALTIVRGLGASAVASLLEILAVEPARSTRRRLLDVMATVVPPHLSALASHVGREPWYVARNVVWLLGHGGEPALPAISKAAAHAEPRVRKEVVRALATIASPDALRGIARYLDDRDEGVIREAVAKLASLRAASAIAAIHGLFRSPRFADFQPETIQAATRALGALGGADSAALLDGLAEAKATRGWLKQPEAKTFLRETAAALRERQRGPTP